MFKAYFCSFFLLAVELSYGLSDDFIEHEVSNGEELMRRMEKERNDLNNELEASAMRYAEEAKKVVDCKPLNGQVKSSSSPATHVKVAQPSV